MHPGLSQRISKTNIHRERSAVNSTYPRVRASTDETSWQETGKDRYSIPVQSNPTITPLPSTLFSTASPALLSPALKVIHTLRDAGFLALFAGGCVRDALLGRSIKDIDIATQAHPDDVERLFSGRTTAVGKAFGVIIVSQDGIGFEVATFRTDGEYVDGRRPAAIHFADAQEDAMRRDFTINGLFCNPLTGELLDFVGGQADLTARIVRAIGDPSTRFKEDHLRLLRAVRFASVLDFTLGSKTEHAVREHAALLRDVSAERIGTEFTRLLCESPRPSQALEMLRTLGLLDVFLPELLALHGLEQPPAYHPEGDVWTHTVLMLDALSAPRDATLAYAVLLHDIGKYPTRQTCADAAGSPVIRFPNHASVGAAMSREILLRLRRPTELINDVAMAIERHMTFPDTPHMRPATLRRFMGAHTFPMEMRLHNLDVTQSHGKLEISRFLEEKQAEFAAETILPKPWISGRDLLVLGMREGPELGHWLRRAYDAQLENRFSTTDELLSWLSAEWKQSKT